MARIYYETELKGVLENGANRAKALARRVASAGRLVGEMPEVALFASTEIRSWLISVVALKMK